MPEGHKPKREKSVRGGYSFDSFDWFAKPYPLFNNKGKTMVASNVGIMMTLIVVVLYLTYAAHEFQKMWMRMFPTVITTLHENEYSEAN